MILGELNLTSYCDSRTASTKGYRGASCIVSVLTSALRATDGYLIAVKLL